MSLKSMLFIICAFLLVLAYAEEEQQPTTLRGGILRPSENCKIKVGKNAFVKLHYVARAWGSSEPFQNTYGGEPLSYQIGRDKIMEGLEKGITGMCPQEIRRILIPAHMAFGEIGVPGSVPPNTAVIYDVEILEVQTALTSPWFWTGLAGIAVAYVYFDRMAKAEDAAKAARYLEKKEKEQNAAKEDQQAGSD